MNVSLNFKRSNRLPRWGKFLLSFNIYKQAMPPGIIDLFAALILSEFSDSCFPNAQLKSAETIAGHDFYLKWVSGVAFKILNIMLLSCIWVFDNFF